MWSSIFFLLLVVAALTSTISLHEVVTVYLHEEWHLSRKAAAWLTTAATAALDVNVAFVSPAARALYLADPEAGLAPATAQAVGLDLRACLTADEAVVRPGARLAVPTGLSVQPHCADVAGFIYSRSGLGARDGLTVAQGVGVVDPDYTGEILVYLLNTSENPLRIKRGDRVAQLIFQPITRPCWREVPSLAATARGAGGFGHTGR